MKKTKNKKVCATLHDVRLRVSAAREADDWPGVLRWEGRMDELMVGLKDVWCDWSLHAFSRAHELGYRSTGNEDHALSIIRLEERRVEILGKLERFRDQGAALCEIAKYLNCLGRTQESATYYQRARDLDAEHVFLSAEREASLRLGRMALGGEWHEEGSELLVAAPINESGESRYELNALSRLIQALFATNAT